MDLRQKIIDAAVRELRNQLSDNAVGQSGTYIQVEGTFRAARVVEAIICSAIVDAPEIVEEVSKAIAPQVDEWEGYTEKTVDALAAMRGSLLRLLDPLP